MILSAQQLEAVGYLFEKSNGQTHQGFEEGIIASNPLPTQNVKELTTAIIQFLETSPEEEEARAMSYWALSKLYDRSLIPLFQSWLKKEVELESGALFQLMIALDNVKEPVFSRDRSGYGAVDVELNLRDAKIYLKQTEMP